MNNNIHIAAIIASAVTAVLLVFAIFAQTTPRVPPVGSAQPELIATLSTTSSATLAANTSTTLFATSTCSARIISASSTALVLSFNDKYSPSGAQGHSQAANTTVVYDAETFGCGKVKALSLTASLITISEIR